jgi:hypothetical protein
MQKSFRKQLHFNVEKNCFNGFLHLIYISKLNNDIKISQIKSFNIIRNFFYWS